MRGSGRGRRGASGAGDGVLTLRFHGEAAEEIHRVRPRARRKTRGMLFWSAAAARDAALAANGCARELRLSLQTPQLQRNSCSTKKAEQEQRRAGVCCSADALPSRAAVRLAFAPGRASTARSAEAWREPRSWCAPPEANYDATRTPWIARRPGPHAQPAGLGGSLGERPRRPGRRGGHEGSSACRGAGPAAALPRGAPGHAVRARRVGQ